MGGVPGVMVNAAILIKLGSNSRRRNGRGVAGDRVDTRGRRRGASGVATVRVLPPPLTSGTGDANRASACPWIREFIVVKEK